MNLSRFTAFIPMGYVAKGKEIKEIPSVHIKEILGPHRCAVRKARGVSPP
jgi:hypothetical protein